MCVIRCVNLLLVFNLLFSIVVFGRVYVGFILNVRVVLSLVQENLILLVSL